MTARRKVVPPKRVRPAVIADVIAAAHLSYRVVSAFEERGGIFFVSYPQQLKSTFIKTLKKFPDAAVLSDINVQQMSFMKDTISQGKVRTIAFDEFNKLYQRTQTTASNLEGIIMAVVSQGWTGPSFQDQRIPIDDVRCLVVGGLTKAVYEHRITEWQESGFAQRFLWCHYKLSNPFAIGDAIENQRKIDIVGEPWGYPEMQIPFELAKPDRERLRVLMRSQAGCDSTPYSLLLKIAAVLKWHYAQSQIKLQPDLHMRVLEEFALMLGSDYAEVEV